MSYPVIFSSLARREANEQAQYLEKKRSGYGRKFNQALREISQKISAKPERYVKPEARPDMCCIRMPKPFDKSHSVYYKFDGKIVRVLCVFPNRRSEKIWQGLE